MRIGLLTNGRADELEMQSKMIEWLRDKNIPFADEVTVLDRKRRADFLLLKDGNQLINIEAKSVAFGSIIHQLEDHATYCDYCFAFIPDYAPTPLWFKTAMELNGFGLIVYNHESKVITEALEAHHNRPKNKAMRHNACELVRKKFNQKYIGK
jgi:hypothetical protein